LTETSELDLGNLMEVGQEFDLLEVASQDVFHLGEEDVPVELKQTNFMSGETVMS